MGHYEFCPNCQAICKTSLSVSIIEATGTGGKQQEVLVFNLHCQACLSFIRRVEEEADKFIEPSIFPAYLP